MTRVIMSPRLLQISPPGNTVQQRRGKRWSMSSNHPHPHDQNPAAVCHTWKASVSGCKKSSARGGEGVRARSVPLSMAWNLLP